MRKSSVKAVISYDYGLHVNVVVSHLLSAIKDSHVQYPRVQYCRHDTSEIIR